MDWNVPLFVLVISAAAFAGDGDVTYDLGKSTRLFASKVYQKLADQPGNLLISPLSVQTVLGLTQTGANGTTLEQMAAALDLPRDPQHVEWLFRNAQTSLNKKRSITLSSANKVYVRDNIKLSQNFQNSAVHFGAEVASFDPAASEATANEINGWVERKTHDKIKDIVKPTDITTDTAMLLINALYFKGQWEYPFEPVATTKQAFMLNEQESVPVDMMYVSGTFGYVENAELDAKFLEMFYTDEDFSMTIILPNKIEGLKNITANIEPYLAQKVKQYEYDYGSEVVVTLPKFKVEGEVQFKNVLEELGMTEAFANADLSGLTESTVPLQISKVVQKTFIDVNESGTEAAAATVAILVDRIVGGNPKTFIANHPFLFVLRQRSTGVVLFLGRYTGL
ncbi:Serpin 42Dd [Carabus blaptoides fortunei]